MKYPTASQLLDLALSRSDNSGREARSDRALVFEAITVIKPAEPFVDGRSADPEPPSNGGNRLPGLDEINDFLADERRRASQRVHNHRADLGEVGVEYQLLRGQPM